MNFYVLTCMKCSLFYGLCSLPSREGDSTSTQVESNEPFVLGSSQAQTESNPLSDDVDEHPEHTEEEEPLGYTSDGDQILSKGRCRSEVWSHFQKIRQKSDGVVKARCIYCKRKYVGHGKSGTSHLKDHVKACFVKKCQDNKQKFLTPGVMMGEGKKGNIQTYNYNPKFARKQLAYLIIMHEYPLSMVDHIGFRRFCHALNPSFHVVSRNTLKKDIFKIYDVERVKSMRFMERCKGKISLTTDMWTSINKKRGFMVVMAHFIDDSWKLKSRIIR